MQQTVGAGVGGALPLPSREDRGGAGGLLSPQLIVALNLRSSEGLGFRVERSGRGRFLTSLGCAGLGGQRLGNWVPVEAGIGAICIASWPPICVIRL